MPNPLIAARQRVTSKEPSEHAPQPVTPVVEQHAGENNPYRGIQDHGVPSDNEPNPPGTGSDTAVGIHYDPPPLPNDPIAVMVVNEYGREMRKWRPYRSFANPGVATAFMGRNLARTSVYIRNIDAAETIWISPEPMNNNAIGGFMLEPGADVTLNTQDDIWVFTNAASVVVVQAIEHYTIEL